MIRTHTSIASDMPSRQRVRSQFQETAEEDHDLELGWYRRHSKNWRPHHPFGTMESTPFRLQITRLVGLRVTKKKSDTDLFVKASCSFVDPTKNTIVSNTSQYTSQEPLQQDRKGIYSTTSPLLLYYHSTADRNSKIQLLIRLQVVEISRIVEMTHEIGFCLVNPFSEVKEKVEKIKRGLWTQSEESTDMEVRFALAYFMELRALKKVVPADTIVTPGDEIPCLFNQQLPSSPDRIDIRLSRSWVAKIRNIDIFVPVILEEEIIKSCQRLKEVSLNTMSERGSKKTIALKRRKVKIGFHNSWTMVNELVRTLQIVEGDKGEFSKTHIVLQAIDDDDELELEVWKNVEGVLALVLIYEVDVGSVDVPRLIQLEVSMTIRAFTLREHSESINELMLKGPSVGITMLLLKTNTDKAPTISFEYELIERKEKMRMTQYTEQKSRQDYHNPHHHDEQAQEEVQRLQDECKQLENQKEDLRLQLQTLRMKGREQLEKEIEQERIAQIQKQAKIQNMYRQQIEQVNRERINLQLQADELMQVLEAKEQALQRQRLQKEEQMRNVVVQEVVKLDEEQLKPTIKNKRQAHISQTLYEELDKKLPPPPKKVVQIKVDPSQYDRYNEASRITLHFVNISSVIGAPVPLPNLFYFNIRFFNMGTFKTDNITYLHNERSQHTASKLVKQAYFIHNQDDVDVVYQFVVDPSLYSNPILLQKDFIDYLAHKKVIVDIFNAETHLYLGQLNIPVNDLMRGRKEQTVSAKEYSLLYDAMHYGNIQIVITNQREVCSREFTINKDTKLPDKKNRTISNNPIVISEADIDKVKETFVKEKIGLKSESRIQQRIRLLKQKKSAQQTMKSLTGFDKAPPLQKQILLQQIEAYKKLKKPSYIRNVYSDFLREHKIISSYFGRAEVFTFDFFNTEDKPNAYRIEIQDPDSPDSPELSVIKQPLEWRYFCEVNRWPMPKSFDSIAENNVFYLHQGERITILFKFVSFRSVGGINTNGAAKTRMLNALINKQSNGKLVGGFTLKVQPHEQVVDQSYIFYENGAQPVEIVLPALYHSPEVTKAKPTLITTYEGVSAAWLNEYEISIQLTAPQIMSRLSFNILLYEDEYLYALKQNWRVQINSYEPISVVCKPNSSVRFRIAIPGADASRRVQLHSSDPATLEVQADFAEGFSLSEGALTVVNCSVKSIDNLSKAIIVHCVESETSELLYGWRVQVVPWQVRKNI